MNATSIDFKQKKDTTCLKGNALYMKTSDVCKNYFNGFHDIYNYKDNDHKTNVLAVLKIFSYFTVVMPLGFAAVYGAACLCGRVSTKEPLDMTTMKTQGEFFATFDKEQTNNSQKPLDGSESLPKVTDKIKQGFFVEVLNKNGYLINGKRVLIPPAGRPEEFTRQEQSFKEALECLKRNHKIGDKEKIEFQFKDKSAEEAINESTAYIIALNFANEHHAGGGPGFHKDKDTHLFVYDAPSARAQEESICQRSDLMVSLTQLPHTLKADSGTNFIRSYYINGFDSTKIAYISANHLFAVQGDKGFYQSHYLEEPKAVVFVTSAAKYYGNSDEVDFNENSNVYKDARRRIETHLLAASFEAAIFKTENPTQPVELILGAFGCGAFVPQKNPNEYRRMIANIYKELLPEFQGFFDVVTFAVPTFGDKNPLNPAVVNHRIFQGILDF